MAAKVNCVDFLIHSLFSKLLHSHLKHAVTVSCGNKCTSIYGAQSRGIVGYKAAHFWWERFTLSYPSSSLWIKKAFALQAEHERACTVGIREIATQPVILWIPLGGKQKWLPLNFGFNDVMRTVLLRKEVVFYTEIDIHFLSNILQSKFAATTSMTPISAIGLILRQRDLETPSGELQRCIVRQNLQVKDQFHVRKMNAGRDVNSYQNAVRFKHSCPLVWLFNCPNFKKIW